MAHRQATDIQSAPVPVRIGLKISQTTDINQKAENFTVVGTLRMQWSMTSLAFDPGRGESDYRTYDVDRFLAMLSERNIRWPEISFYNQQGRSAVQNKIVHLEKDGSVQYLERFTATFQAPDFDFTRFPFDTQRLKVTIDSVFSERGARHAAARPSIGDKAGFGT